MENRCITYRQAVAEDLKAIAGIDDSTHRHWTFEQFSHDFTLPYSRTVVAQNSEGIAGFIVIWFLPPEVQILNIAVDPAYRRRGVARHLLGHALTSLPASEPLSVIIEVREGNTPARRFYSSLGFRQISMRRAYYGDEDAIVLQGRYP